LSSLTCDVNFDQNGHSFFETISFPISNVIPIVAAKGQVYQAQLFLHNSAAV